MLVGYARVSSVGQNLTSQIEILEKIGCEKIFTEKKSGKESTNRPTLQDALDFVRGGDTFVVTRLDRLARNTLDLHSIIDLLDKKGVSFKCTEQEIDTTTSQGKLMLGLLSIVSAFETDLRAERQADGIKSALARGKKWGRKPVDLSEKDIKEAIKLQKTVTNQEIADKFGIGRSTLLRYIKEYRRDMEEQKNLS